MVRFPRATAAGFAAAFVAVTASAEPMRFELSDGTVLQGELVSVEKGQLAIDSPTIGRVLVPQSKVVSMTSAKVRPPAPPPAASEPKPIVSSASATRQTIDLQAAALRQAMAMDPQLMQQLSDLQRSPLMQEILSDPELIQKVLTGDVEALSSDPRIQQLMADPRVGEIQRNLTE